MLAPLCFTLLALILRVSGLTQDAVLYTVPKVARLVQRGHFSSALNHLRAATLSLQRAAVVDDTIVVDGINTSVEDELLLASLGSPAAVLRVREADVLMLQATVMRASGQLEAAADAATRSLELMSKFISKSTVLFADVARLGGTLLMDAGRYGAALDALSAPSPTTWSQQHRFRIAEVHGRLGNYIAARRHYALLAEDWRRPVSSLMQQPAAAAPPLRPATGDSSDQLPASPVAGWLGTAGLGAAACLLTDSSTCGATAGGPCDAAGGPPGIPAELVTVFAAHNAEVGMRLGSPWFLARVIGPALAGGAPANASSNASSNAPPCASDGDPQAPGADASESEPELSTASASPGSCRPAASTDKSEGPPPVSWRAALRQACSLVTGRGGGGASSPAVPASLPEARDAGSAAPEGDAGEVDNTRPYPWSISEFCASDSGGAAALSAEVLFDPRPGSSGTGAAAASSTTSEGDDDAAEAGPPALPMPSRRDAHHPLARDWPTSRATAEPRAVPLGTAAVAAATGAPPGAPSSLTVLATLSDLGSDSTLVPLPTALLQVRRWGGRGGRRGPRDCRACLGSGFSLDFARAWSLPHKQFSSPIAHPPPQIAHPPRSSPTPCA